MSNPTKREAYIAWVLPNAAGFTVTCSCGYLVMGLPNQQLAQADLDNHVSRSHPREDESPNQEKGN